MRGGRQLRDGHARRSSAITTVNGKTGTAELGPRHQERRLVRRLCAGRGAAGGGLGADRARRRGRRDGGADRAADDRGRPAVSGVRGIVLDMEGVLHVDWSPIAGSAAAVAELAAARHRAGRAHEHHRQDACDDRGAAGGDGLSSCRPSGSRPPHRPPPSTSAPSIAGERVYALVEPRRRSASWTGSSWSTTPGSAEVVLLGGPDESWTYRRLNAVFRALLGGVPLVAMQRTAGGRPPTARRSTRACSSSGWATRRRPRRWWSASPRPRSTAAPAVCWGSIRRRR